MTTSKNQDQNSKKVQEDIISLPTAEHLKPQPCCADDVYGTSLLNLYNDKEKFNKILVDCDKEQSLVVVNATGSIKLNPKALAVILAELLDFVVDVKSEKGILYGWNVKRECFELISEAVFEHEVCEAVKQIKDSIISTEESIYNITTSGLPLKDLVNKTKMRLERVEGLQVEDAIYVKDIDNNLCLLNANTSEIRPYNKDSLVLKPPLSYESRKACEQTLIDNCPRFYNLINSMLQESTDRELLYKYLGLTLIPINRAGISMNLVGEAGCGKGTIISVMKKIAWGNTVDASKIVEDRVASADLASSRMTVYDEAPKDLWDGKCGQILKSWIDSFDIGVRYLFKGYQEITGKVHCITTANTLFEIKTSIDAALRRIIVLECRKTFKQKDDFLTEKIVENEGEEIVKVLIAYAIQARREITIFGELQLTEEQQISKESCKAGVYTPQEFIEDFVESSTDSNDAILFSELKRIYKEAAADRKLEITNLNYLTVELEKQYGVRRSRVSSGGRRAIGFKDVKLNENIF